VTHATDIEFARLWRDEQLGGLELLRARYLTFAFAPHFHDTYAIGITDSGAQAFSNGRGGRTALMPAGSVAVVHPGEVHTSRAGSEGGWAYRMLYPPADLLERIASEAARHPRGMPLFRSPVIEDDDLAGLVRRLHSSLEDPATPTIERDSRLTWMLTQLVVRHSDGRQDLRRPSPLPQAVRSIRDFLNDAYAENVSLQQLVDLVHLSRFHLLRLFRDAMGLPPHAYLTQVRVHRAQALLREALSVAEVAAQTGFFDQSHLTRHFRSIVGMPPGRYQREQLRTRRA
jgi:AraC-like DNA-binding protein